MDTGYGTTLLPESIKVIAESVGICNLPDESANILAEEDAVKCMQRGRRQKLTTRDVNYALKSNNVEPLHGYQYPGELPFRTVCGGGRELQFVEEKEIELSELIAEVTKDLKLPLDTCLRTHWLAIDGVQLSVPENPTPVSEETQTLKATNPSGKKFTAAEIGRSGRKAQKLQTTEIVNVKPLSIHDLSVEQQYYYKIITEACVGSDEAKRVIGLHSLTVDPGLHEMLPRLCTFITEGVRINVSEGNLAILIYFMRMVRAIIDNSSLYLERYLHELIPAVLSCIVSKQLCSRPKVDNHWALRDFASRLMAQICKTYTTSTNNIQTRVARIFTQALTKNDEITLPSLYGAINGLCELGPEVIETLVIPKISVFSERLEAIYKNPETMSVDRISAGHLKTLIIKSVAPVLKNLRPGPDFLGDYKEDYGYLGPALCTAVAKQRKQVNPRSSAQFKAMNVEKVAFSAQ